MTSKVGPGGLSSVRRDFGESDSAPMNPGQLAVSAMLFHTCVHTWHGRTGVWTDLASFIVPRVQAPVNQLGLNREKLGAFKPLVQVSKSPYLQLNPQLTIGKSIPLHQLRTRVHAAPEDAGRISAHEGLQRRQQLPCCGDSSGENGGAKRRP